MASRTHIRPRAGFVHHLGLTSSSLLATIAASLAMPLASEAPAATASGATVAIPPPQERLPLGPRRSGADGSAATASRTAAPLPVFAGRDEGSERRQLQAVDAPPPLLAAPAPLGAGAVPTTPRANEPAQVSPVPSTTPNVPTRDGSASAAHFQEESASPSTIALRGHGDATAAAGPSAGQPKSLLPSWLGDDLLLRGVLPIAVIAVLAVALRGVIAKSLGRTMRPSGVLEILARFPTGRGQQVAMLRLGRRVLVVHQSDRTMTTLCEVTDADEVAELISKSREGAKDSFTRLLARHRDAVDPFDGVETIDLTARGRAARPPQTPRERTLPMTEMRG